MCVFFWILCVCLFDVSHLAFQRSVQNTEKDLRSSCVASQGSSLFNFQAVSKPNINSNPSYFNILKLSVARMLHPIQYQSM